MKRIAIITFCTFLFTLKVFSQTSLGILDSTVTGFNPVQSDSGSITFNAILKNCGNTDITSNSGININIAVDSSNGFIPRVVDTLSVNINSGDSLTINANEDFSPTRGYRIGTNIIVIWPSLSSGALSSICDSAVLNITVVPNSMMSLIEIDKNKELKVYPNPTIDVLNISGKDSRLVQQIKVIDYTGRTIYNSYNRNEIYFGSYKSGLYLIEVTFKDNTRKTFNIVKQQN